MFNNFVFKIFFYNIHQLFHLFLELFEKLRN
jgi:hypothetical protein